MTKNVTVQWNGRKVLVQKFIEKKGSYPFRTTHIAKEARIVYEGEFIVEIDLDRIIAKIALCAGHNRSGKASYLGGMIRAKRLTTKEISREEQEYPVPQDYVVIGEKVA